MATAQLKDSPRASRASPGKPLRASMNPPESARFDDGCDGGWPAIDLFVLYSNCPSSPVNVPLQARCPEKYAFLDSTYPA